MKKLSTLVAVLVLSITVGIVSGLGLGTAHACYEGGYKDGSFGPNGFSIHWLSPDEPASFVQFVQLGHEGMKMEWEANPDAYNAKYEPVLRVVAIGMKDEFGNKHHPFDGAVRSKLIQNLALLNFERC